MWTLRSCACVALCTVYDRFVCAVVDGVYVYQGGMRAIYRIFRGVNSSLRKRGEIKCF